MWSGNKNNLSTPSYYIVVRTGATNLGKQARHIVWQLGPDFPRQLNSLPMLGARVPIWSSPGASGSISSCVPKFWSKVGEQIFRTTVSPARCQLTFGAPCIWASVPSARQDLEASRKPGSNPQLPSAPSTLHLIPTRLARWSRYPDLHPRFGR